MSLVFASSVKISIVILIGLAAAALLRNRSAAVRHWIVAMTIVCASAIPVLERYLPAWGIDLTSDTPAAVATIAPESTAAAADDVTFSVTASAAASSDRVSWSDVLMAAWTVGAALSVLILATGFVRLTWLAARARAVDAGRWIDLADRIGRDYGLKRPVRILESEHPSLLVTWGLLAPKVIVPRAAREWSDARIAIVLRHELAHIRRGDWVVQIVGELLRSIYWFNPLLWIACTRLRLESEQACDDEVIAAGVEGQDYASHLVELARTLKAEAAPYVPAPAVARPSSLERRIRAMLDARLTRTPATRPARLLTAALFLSVTVAIAAAQTGPVKMTGSVFDPTGAPVPGVTVALVNTQTKARHEVRTDSTGYYEFVPLPADRYTLEVAFPGFQKLEDPVTLSGSSARRDLTIALGTLRETVTVGRGTDTAVVAAPGSVVEMKGDGSRDRFQKALEECKPSTIGGRIVPPRKLRDVRPVYPAHLQDAGITGTVGLKAVIGTDGTVREVTIDKSAHPELDASAMDAVRQWKFDGTLLNCNPVDVSINVSVSFQ